MSLERFRKQMAEQTVEGLYYLLGEEQYLIDHYYGQCRTCCTGALPEMNLIELDGKKPNFDLLADAASSYPVMSDKKLVTVTDFDPNALKGGGEKKLTAALADLAPGVVVLFREHAKEKTKANALETLIKKLGGMVVKIEKPDNVKLRRWIQKLAAAAETEISAADSDYLTELTGGSMLRIHKELKKLTAGRAGGTIDRALIEQMVAPEDGADRYAISNALAAHDFDALMQALEAFYRMGVEDTVIADKFYRAYTDLWRGQAALREGKSAAELAEACHISPYAAARIMRSAAALREGEALYGLRRCLELDQKIKTSGLNKRDLVYGLVSELLEYQMRDL